MTSCSCPSVKKLYFAGFFEIQQKTNGDSVNLNPDSGSTSEITLKICILLFFHVKFRGVEAFECLAAHNSHKINKKKKYHCVELKLAIHKAPGKSKFIVENKVEYGIRCIFLCRFKSELRFTLYFFLIRFYKNWRTRRKWILSLTLIS